MLVFVRRQKLEQFSRYRRVCLVNDSAFVEVINRATQMRPFKGSERSRKASTLVGTTFTMRGSCKDKHSSLFQTFPDGDVSKSPRVTLGKKLASPFIKGQDQGVRM